MATEVKQKKCTKQILIATSTSPVNKHIVKVAMRNYTTASEAIDKVIRKKAETQDTVE